MHIISRIAVATALAAATAAATLIAATAFASTASANPFEALFGQHRPTVQAPAYQSQDRMTTRSWTDRSQFRRQIVDYRTSEAPGTIIIDTPNTYLYLVMSGGKAMRYGIGVGRDGFTWAGTQTITRKAEWPDWTPPEEMLQRQPYLPRFMAGGPGNPMGARAMYLGSSIYRIHGTNAPDTIGQRVSSGCIRLTNDDVEDLYSRVNVGTKVVVRADQRQPPRRRRADADPLNRIRVLSTLPKSFLRAWPGFVPASRLRAPRPVGCHVIRATAPHLPRSGEGAHRLSQPNTTLPTRTSSVGFAYCSGEKPDAFTAGAHSAASAFWMAAN